jgi:hypothetical protein
MMETQLSKPHFEMPCQRRIWGVKVLTTGIIRRLVVAALYYVYNVLKFSCFETRFSMPGERARKPSNGTARTSALILVLLNTQILPF